MYVADLLTCEAIQLNAEVQTKEQAIELLVNLMEKNGNISDKKLFHQAVLKREKLGSTGISSGIAIPHAKSSAVIRPGLSAITVHQGIDFAARDGLPSRIFFMIAAQDGLENMHVEILGKLSLLLIEDNARTVLLGATDNKQFITYLNRLEAKKFNGLF